MAKYRNDNFQSLLKLIKALSDKNRLRIFMVLLDRELCVCQITELLKLAPSTVSKHLLILKNSGILNSHKNGRWIFYSITEKLSSHQKNFLGDIRNSLAKDNTILKDSKRIQEILILDTELLCKTQSGRSND